MKELAGKLLHHQVRTAQPSLRGTEGQVLGTQECGSRKPSLRPGQPCHRVTKGTVES